MKTSEVVGYILSRRNIGEGDLLLETFTREQGRVRVVARGARKPRAKLRSHLEPFVPIALRLAKGRSMDVVIGAQAVRVNQLFSAPLMAKSAAYVLTEVVQKTTAEGQVLEPLYDIYEQCLQLLVNGVEPALALSYGLMALLQTEGSEPELPKAASDKLYFNLDAGVVSAQVKADSVPVSQPVIKLWRVILNYNASTVARIKAEPEVLAESVEVLTSYIRFRFHTSLKSLEVFQASNI